MFLGSANFGGYEGAEQKKKKTKTNVLGRPQRWDRNLKERLFDYFMVHRGDSHCLILSWGRA